MNFLNYQSHLKIILKNYTSCSLVNGEGTLLYSKDTNLELLTTTRLVAFQIIKKYLNPKPQDFFVLNDPENGGYHYSKLIFISCLTTNLFLIWDEDNFFIDFKIPPTPLFEKGVRNDFIWQALVQTSKYSQELESFFDLQKNNIDRILKLKEILNALASAKNQQIWLNSTNEIFSIQFASKAQGGFEAYHQVLPNCIIKLKFTAEEKQNQKLLTLDFTNTNLATQMHTSSHVIESAIIKKIIDFYQINSFFTQSILDKIKIILPPRSIVSRPHPTGEYNLELQSVCSQMCEHNMKQLNTYTRKSQTAFEYTNYLNFEIHTDKCHANNIISSQIVFLNKFEELVTSNSISLKKMKRLELINQIKFEVCCDSPIKVNIKNNYFTEKSNNTFKVNNELLQRGEHNLKKNDVVEIIWA
ncbi:MAG: hypothetical protein AABY53_04860 [Bdellovibrionota bacterium]